MPTKKIINLKEIFDANSDSKSNDGLISTDKIGNLLRYTGLNPTEQMCRQIKKSLGKEMMDFEDFSKIYENNQETSMEFKEMIEGTTPNGDSEASKIESMIRAIKTFDHRNSGFISINELKFILTGLGDKLTDEQFYELKQFMEFSPSGQVSYEQFINSVNDA